MTEEWEFHIPSLAKYVYVSMYVCTHVHVCGYMYVCLHACMCICMYVCVYVCVCMHACTVCVSMCVCMCGCTHAYLYAFTSFFSSHKFFQSSVIVISYKQCQMATITQMGNSYTLCVATTMEVKTITLKENDSI
jgi:hypothetical protein